MRVNPSEVTNARTADGLEIMMSKRDWTQLSHRIEEHLLAGPGVIVEYGAGISTIAIADLLKSTELKLISIEHDKEWYAKVLQHLTERNALDRVNLINAPLDFHQGLWRYARPEEEMGAGAKRYIDFPSPAWDWTMVKVAFVDGIARGPCLAYLRTKLNPGTPVFLHDYTGRETWYDWAVDLYERVDQYDLMLELRTP